MRSKIGAIVQTRMSSKRFFGKVLYQINGKPILGYLLESLSHCKYLDTVIVATSTQESDNPIADYCRELGIACYRGSLYDVASRFVGVLDRFEFDAFLRITGDSPLLDYRIIDAGVNIFNSGRFDIVTNAFKKTFPKGQTVEILRANMFKHGYELMKTEDEFEHVTPYFYKHSGNLKIHNFVLPKNLNDIQLSVDTQEDMNTFIAIVSKMEKEHWRYSLDDILDIHNNLALEGKVASPERKVKDVETL